MWPALILGEVKCEQDILTAIIEALGLSPQGADGTRVVLDVGQ